jgi:hypothetical protein
MAAAGAPRNPNAAILGLFDYSLTAHTKIYDKNIESLYGSDKTTAKFDLVPEQLQEFIARVGIRAKRCGWENMLTYPVNGAELYIISHYGEVPAQAVRVKALAYLAAGARLSQDSEQLYQCLLNSITADALNRLMNVKEEFNVNVGAPPNVREVTDGPLLLATIISLSYTNTRSMGAIYRTNITNLHDKMQQMKDGNVKELNAYVRLQRNLIAAGGGTCEDLAYHLIRAYKQTGDAEFTTYIKQKEQAWKDGSLTWDSQGNELMKIAETYYIDAIENGVWRQASADQVRIIALEAQILATENLMQGFALAGVHSPNAKGKVTGQRDPRPPRKLRPQDAWKKVAPKAQDPKTKQVNRKTYHWCIPHEMWTIHSSSECRLQPALQTTANVMSTVVEAALSDDEDADSFSDGSQSQDSNTL